MSNKKWSEYEIIIIPSKYHWIIIITLKYYVRVLWNNVIFETCWKNTCILHTKKLQVVLKSYQYWCTKQVFMSLKRKIKPKTKKKENIFYNLTISLKGKCSNMWHFTIFLLLHTTQMSVFVFFFRGWHFPFTSWNTCRSKWF